MLLTKYLHDYQGYPDDKQGQQKYSPNDAHLTASSTQLHKGDLKTVFNAEPTRRIFNRNHVTQDSSKYDKKTCQAAGISQIVRHSASHNNAQLQQLQELRSINVQL